MGKKAAFTKEEKIHIVREHEERHKTLKQIVNEYDISKSYLCLLLKQYRESGEAGLENTKYYTAEFKMQIIRDHFEEGISIADLTRKYGIQYRVINEWTYRYTKKGEAGITDLRRGRPRKQNTEETPGERIKQLEMENEVLRSFLEEYERWDAKGSSSK